MEEPDVLQRLSDWLARRDPDRGRPALTALGKPGSGYSAENLVIGARWDDGSEEKLVLRRDTSEPPIYPAQSAHTTTGVILQHSVMDALRRGGRVPVADSLGLESDPEVLGAPFFVMGHVAGDVPGEDPPYTRSGFFVEAAPAQRSQLIAEGLRTLARVHETDVDDPGLAMLRPEGVRPVPNASSRCGRADLREGLAGRSSPLFEETLSWLHEELPPETAARPLVG